MYALPAASAALDYRVHSRRRTRSPWPARAARASAVAIAIAILSIGMARAVEGGAAGPYETITVQPGDSLWSIASERYAGSDVRARVFQIEQANHLAGAAIEAGETLKVPTR